MVIVVLKKEISLCFDKCAIYRSIGMQWSKSRVTTVMLWLLLSPIVGEVMALFPFAPEEWIVFGSNSGIAETFQFRINFLSLSGVQWIGLQKSFYCRHLLNIHDLAPALNSPASCTSKTKAPAAVYVFLSAPLLRSIKASLHYLRWWCQVNSWYIPPGLTWGIMLIVFNSQTNIIKDDKEWYCSCNNAD